jgi:hypothetical protein
MSTESSRFIPPKVKGYDRAYELSYQIACETLRNTTDLGEQCDRAGAVCSSTATGKRILLKYLGLEHVITLPDVEIEVADGVTPVALRDKLLMLHYFNTAKGTARSGRQVTFRELPAGPVYFPTYMKRAIKPFTDAFGKEPMRLLAAGAKLGGKKGGTGDASVIIDAFPRIAITYVLWGGDVELPPQGNILYDANITDYLPTEDITVLTESISWKLVHSGTTDSHGPA